jgi:hypothetical protein
MVWGGRLAGYSERRSGLVRRGRPFLRSLEKYFQFVTARHFAQCLSMESIFSSGFGYLFMDEEGFVAAADFAFEYGGRHPGATRERQARAPSPISLSPLNNSIPRPLRRRRA